MTGTNAQIGIEAVSSVIGRAEKKEIALSPLEMLGLKIAVDVLRSVRPSRRTDYGDAPIKF